jgi:hypothetical protein
MLMARPFSHDKIRLLECCRPILFSLSVPSVEVIGTKTWLAMRYEWIVNQGFLQH